MWTRLTNGWGVEIKLRRDFPNLQYYYWGISVVKLKDFTHCFTVKVCRSFCLLGPIPHVFRTCMSLKVLRVSVPAYAGARSRWLTKYPDVARAEIAVPKARKNRIASLLQDVKVRRTKQRPLIRPAEKSLKSASNIPWRIRCTWDIKNLAYRRCRQPVSASHVISTPTSNDLTEEGQHEWYSGQ